MPSPIVQIAGEAGAEARVAALFGEIEGATAHAECAWRLLHPRYRPSLTRFVEQDGRVAAAALLRHDRWLVDGAVVDVGHVENILTHPDFRRTGLFNALLADCLQTLAGEGFAFASLHGPVTLYAPFGYVPVRHHAQVLLAATDAALLSRYGRARPFAAEDLPDIVALYADNYSRLAASEERTDGVWRWLLPEMGETLVVEDSGGRVLAYARIDQARAGNRRRVIEAAVVDTQAALALLLALGERAAQLPPAASPALIYLPLPPEHPVAHAALLAGGEARLVGPLPTGSRSGHEDQAMVLDQARALDALSPAFGRRLACSAYAGWEGRLGLETEDGLTALEINRTGVVASPLRGPLQGLIHLPAALLAPLLLGTYGAGDLGAWPGVQLPESLAGLMGVLFPLRRPTSENENWWIHDQM